MGNSKVDEIIGKSSDNGGDDSPQDKSSDGSGIQSKEGLSKKGHKSDVDLASIMETGTSDVGGVEEEYGYSFPLTILEQGGKGTGKAQPINEPVLTPDGWQAIGKLEEGNVVIGRDGKPTEVTGVHDRGLRDVYEVQFHDGSSTRCCDEHLWTVNSQTSPKRWETMELRDLASDIENGAGDSKWSIPAPAPIEFREVELPLHPYVLGVLLGDGNFDTTGVKLTNGSDEIVEKVRERLPDGVAMRPDAEGEHRLVNDHHNSGNIREGGTVVTSRILDILRKFGLHEKLSTEKFIPQLYLWAGQHQRVALLQGLMDTDGWQPDDGGPTFNTSSPRLVKDFKHLAESLGCVVSTTHKDPSYTYDGETRTGERNFAVRMRVPEDFEPFTFSEKAKDFSGTYKPKRILRGVEHLGEEPTVCITVAKDDGLYVTKDFIVTHNSSDYASPDIPRPIGDETTHILTASRETRTAIFDRWGGIPDYVNLVKFYEVYDPTDVSTATEAFTHVEVFLEELIESGGGCNVIIDDLENWYEDVAVDKCRHEFGLSRGESLFGNASTDFWVRRKAIGKDFVNLAMKAAQHLFVVSGYDENVTMEMREVGGDKKLVEVVEDPRWVDPFEKPFDITLLRERVEEADEDMEGGSGDVQRFIKVLTSKFNRLFPEGQRYNVEGSGIAKFFTEYQAREGNQNPDLTDEDTGETKEDEG